MKLIHKVSNFLKQSGLSQIFNLKEKVFQNIQNIEFQFVSRYLDLNEIEEMTDSLVSYPGIDKSELINRAKIFIKHFGTLYNKMIAEMPYPNLVELMEKNAISIFYIRMKNGDIYAYFSYTSPNWDRNSICFHKIPTKNPPVFPITSYFIQGGEKVLPENAFIINSPKNTVSNG